MRPLWTLKELWNFRRRNNEIVAMPWVWWSLLESIFQWQLFFILFYFYCYFAWKSVFQKFVRTLALHCVIYCIILFHKFCFLSAVDYLQWTLRIKNSYLKNKVKETREKKQQQTKDFETWLSHEIFFSTKLKIKNGINHLCFQYNLSTFST